LHASGLENDANSPMIIPFVNEIVGMAALHLDDALKYTLLVPRHLKSVRMFLIVPVYFAAETLWLVKTNPVKAMVGPPAKISRGDVTRLVGAAAARIGSNRKLSEYYYKLRHRI
jgi:farnesyl-diphosphate farnesyltransferase